MFPLSGNPKASRISGFLQEATEIQKSVQWDKKKATTTKTETILMIKKKTFYKNQHDSEID